MGISPSAPACIPRPSLPSPVVSRYAFFDDDDDNDSGGLSGERSMIGRAPQSQMILEWQEGVPDARELEAIPTVEIVSDGEAEAIAWDMSVSAYNNLSNDVDDKVHYVSAILLKTPNPSLAKRKKERVSCMSCS
ncbi:hypothetical protein DQ04_00831010 [Trypanosoma grayi]|uniref:hypothetical protein n=1 Tax=Trypanosoma grayi TaxID=71804 RepID=UPI0004F3F0F2|nr:hypothetical protein DQ04_00831010 [Trypanosoma grayi]KEG13704.1 hypothetical protein DQ04_00831010 [Trypanosoma grayi]